MKIKQTKSVNWLSLKKPLTTNWKVLNETFGCWLVFPLKNNQTTLLSWFHNPGAKIDSVSNIHFQKSTDINMDIHDFCMSVFNYLYQCGYRHWYLSRDIHARTSFNGYPYTINIHEWISTFYGYQSSINNASTDIHLDILGFLRISMHRLATDSRSSGLKQVWNYLKQAVLLWGIVIFSIGDRSMDSARKRVFF